MKKKWMICLALALWAMCGWGMAESKLSIVATDFPCYDFARQVSGEYADVTLLIQPGMEVHGYDPSPADLLKIGGADLFIYIGGESDAWVDDILASFGDDVPTVLRMMDAVEALPEEGEAHDHASEGGIEYDEHIWTSPANAASMVLAVSEALCALDTPHADAYRAAADACAGEIAQIDAAISDIAAHAARNVLVFADRFPFLYLTRAYGFEYLAAFPSCSADAEVSPKTLMTLIQRVKDDHIPVIYTIEMSSQNIARTVAEETGTEICTLHSIQNVTLDEFNAGESYVSIMWKNVEALRRGLM